MHPSLMIGRLFQINFFLYAITGKAFRHELKRLFTSIAVQMHLAKETVPKATQRRSIGFNPNYLASETFAEQQFRERRSSPYIPQQLLRSGHSIDSTTSNPSSILRPLRMQSPPIAEKTNPNVRYYIQRISAV